MESDAIVYHAAAVILAYAALRLISIVYRTWRRREGLGEGDAKLLAAAGAWVELDRLSEVVLMGALLGLALALAQAMRRGVWQTDMPIAFGPRLALATWLAWLEIARSGAG